MTQPKASRRRAGDAPARPSDNDKLHPHPHWRGRFLAALAETSNVSLAAMAAEVNPSRAYKARRDEPAFAHDWHRALCEGYDLLELEVLHRLRFGEPRGDGDRRFDTAVAIRQLAAHRETVSRLRAGREGDDAATVRASIDAKLARLREQVVARTTAPEDDSNESR